MFELLHVIGECQISFWVYFAGSSKPQRLFTNCRGIRIKRLANWFHNWIIVFFALVSLYLAPPCIIAQIAPYSGKCQGRCIYSVTLLSFQITSLLVYFWIIHCTDIISWYVLDCSINCAWIGLCKTSTEGLFWVIKQELLHCWCSDLLSTQEVESILFKWTSNTAPCSNIQVQSTYYTAVLPDFHSNGNGHDFGASDGRSANIPQRNAYKPNG